MAASLLAALLCAAAPAAGAQRSGPLQWTPPQPAPLDSLRAAAVDAKRDEIIARLQRILPGSEDGEERPELLFQLAEAFSEKSRVAFQQEVREHDEAVSRWLAAGGGGDEPRFSSPRTDDLRRRALEAVEEIVQRHPGYRRMDEALFVLAYDLEEMGRKEDATRAYARLIREHPQSRLVPDAWIQIGEHAFAANDLARARAAYARAAGTQRPKIYAFAVYKLAWCDYNAGDLRGAIGRFQEVVQHADRQADAAASRDRVQLRQEALRDLALAFFRIDAVDEAVAYFSARSRESAIELIDRLASLYFEGGKFELSMRVDRILEERAPTHARAPVWQQRIVAAAERLDRRDQVAAEVGRLVAFFSPQSGWARSNADDRAALSQATELSESALRDLAQGYHQEAARTKSTQALRLVRDLYHRYLEAFPEAEAANQVRFYLAEVHFGLEEFEEAAALYGEAAERDPRGAFAAKAATDAVLAVEKAIVRARAQSETVAPRRSEVDRSARASRSAAEEGLSDLEGKLVAACDRYARLVPGGKDEVLFRYRAALVFYQRRHDEEAFRRFAGLIAAFPEDPWARKAADLSMDIVEGKRDLEALATLADTYHADARLSPPGSELWKRTAEVAESARFTAVLEIHRKGADEAAAARGFARFVERYPASRNAALALNNEIVIAEKAQELDLVLAAARKLIAEHPHAPDEVLKPALLALAAASASTARYAETLEARRTFADRFPDDPRAPDTLASAAVWAEALGDEGKALELYRLWLHRYGRRREAARVAFSAGTVLERRKDPRAAAAHWSAFAREYATTASREQLLLARYKEGIALRALGVREREWARALSSAFAGVRALPEAQRTAALAEAGSHARFLLLETAFRDFVSVGFTSARERDLVRALQSKNAAMQRLLDGYTEVVRLGSPTWTQAALVRLGEAYRSFNRALLDAPAPRGLDEEQRELYRSALEGQALPLEDKADDALRKALETAKSTSVAGEWTKRAQEMLGESAREGLPDRHPTAARRSDPALASGADVLLQGAASGARREAE